MNETEQRMSNMLGYEINYEELLKRKDMEDKEEESEDEEQDEEKIDEVDKNTN